MPDVLRANAPSVTVYEIPATALRAQPNELLASDQPYAPGEILTWCLRTDPRRLTVVISTIPGEHPGTRFHCFGAEHWHFGTMIRSEKGQTTEVSSMNIPLALGGDGVEYEVWKQEKEHSCAAACFCMIMWMKKRQSLTETEARLLLEHARAKFISNRDIERGRRRAWESINWSSEGLGAGELVMALSQLLPMAKRSVRLGPPGKPADTRIARDRDQIKALLAFVTPQTPGVLGIKWDAGGDHVVVVANRLDHCAIVIDPAKGMLLLADNHLIDKGYYMPRDPRMPRDNLIELRGSVAFLTLFP